MMLQELGRSHRVPTYCDYPIKRVKTCTQTRWLYCQASKGRLQASDCRTCGHDEPNGGSHQERLKRGAIKINRINLKAGCSSNRQDKVNEAEAADLIRGVDAGQVGPGASGEQGLDCRRVPAHSCVVQRCAAILMRGGRVEIVKVVIFIARERDIQM
jgi:hypothetical protein